MVYPRTVTHPSTNRARRIATTLIKTNALPLSQAATLELEKGVTKFKKKTVTWFWPCPFGCNSSSAQSCHVPYVKRFLIIISARRLHTLLRINTK